MDKKQKRNRLLVILIFSMSIIPFFLAWFLTGNTSFIKGKINYGELIAPVVTTDYSDFIGLDNFSKEHMDELKGHWLLVNVMPEVECNSVCLDAIHKTKQLRLMMNKDLTRIRRAVITLKSISPEQLAQNVSIDKDLLKVKPSDSLNNKISNIYHGKVENGALIIIDPLGNLMMQYKPGFDSYKVKSDLMHLLRISQIG